MTTQVCSTVTLWKAGPVPAGSGMEVQGDGEPDEVPHSIHAIESRTSQPQRRWTRIDPLRHQSLLGDGGHLLETDHSALRDAHLTTSSLCSATVTSFSADGLLLGEFAFVPSSLHHNPNRSFKDTRSPVFTAQRTIESARPFLRRTIKSRTVPNSSWCEAVHQQQLTGSWPQDMDNDKSASNLTDIRSCMAFSRFPSALVQATRLVATCNPLSTT